MLQLVLENSNLSEIIGILCKNRVKSEVIGSSIIIKEPVISEKVIEELMANAVITRVTNYQTETSATELLVGTENSFEDNDYKMTVSENEIAEPIAEANPVFETMVKKFDIQSLKTNANHNSRVYRGEVYEFGGGIKEEIGLTRACVIVIQNDLETYWDETLVLFCVSKYDENNPIGYKFRFSKTNMSDYAIVDDQILNYTFLIRRIRQIRKEQLGKYLGRMNSFFMNSIQYSIDFCMGLKRKRTMDWFQIKILSRVNMEDVIKIAESKDNAEKRVDEYLKLFGFDMSINGCEYVKAFILTAYNLKDNYTLEFLAEKVAEKFGVEVEPDEILRLVVARTKENFGFHKSCATSFIRLMDRLLRGGETL